MSESTSSHIILKIWCFILGLALLLTGLFFTVGGVKLVTLGGSWYFVISGLLTLVSAFLFLRKKH
jgi:quinate dehydrogenase (quinone)